MSEATGVRISEADPKAAFPLLSTEGEDEEETFYRQNVC